ncbi:cytochrome P450 [Streptomyces sp. NPDC050538]|uniref:cytochrome P450 n=1 Tax=Streptomyces sp. NPDC050538 TaxID=3365627 RepID=UPI00379584FE
MTSATGHGDTDPQDYPFVGATALEPPAQWAALREKCPVTWVRTPGGAETALLTRYEDVRKLFADRRFRRNLAAEDTTRLDDSEDGGLFHQPNPDEEGISEADFDRADHTRWRSVLTRALTGRRLDELRPRIAAKADELIDAMTARPGPADLVSALARPLPLWVICEALAIPLQDQERILRWSTVLLSLTRHTRSEMDQAAGDFYAYMIAHIENRRVAPGDDVISELTAIVDAGEGRFDEAELASAGIGLLVAGHETTSQMIGKMTAMLLADRDRWRELLADPGLVPTAVEEALRFDANHGFALPRYLSADVEFGGTTLTRGCTVLAEIAAANRDVTVFPHPDRMDLRRAPNPHLTFGYGPQICVGREFARNELRTVLATLLKRLPTLELALPAHQLKRRSGILVGGLEELPVRW